VKYQCDLQFCLFVFYGRASGICLTTSTSQRWSY